MPTGSVKQRGEKLRERSLSRDRDHDRPVYDCPDCGSSSGSSSGSSPMTTKTLRSARCGSVVRSYLFDRVTVIQLPACFGLSPPPPHPPLRQTEDQLSSVVISYAPRCTCHFRASRFCECPFGADVPRARYWHHRLVVILPGEGEGERSTGIRWNGRVDRALNARIAAIASAGAYRRLFLRLDIEKGSTTCSSH